MRPERRRTLEGKLMATVLGLFVAPAVVALGLLLVLFDRGVFADLRSFVLVVAVGLSAMMAYLAWMAHALGRVLVRAVAELHRGAELIATVNPGYRIRLDTGDELEALAGEINRMADRLELARRALDSEAAVAVESLQREHRLLVDTLDGLHEGVVVATARGIVTLANQQAVELLVPGPAGLLGRNLFELVDHAAVDRELARRAAGERAAGDFFLGHAGGRALVGGVSVFGGDSPSTRGLILTVRGAPEPAAGPGAGLVGTGVRAGPGPVTPRPASVLYEFPPPDGAVGPPPAGAVERLLDQLTCVVLDVETTGLRPDRGDEVVSLAAVRVSAGAVRSAEVFDALVRPRNPIPEASSRIHGVTDEMVRDAPSLAEVLPAFLRFAEGAVLVGHEVWFDLAFLDSALERSGLPRLAVSHAVLDTRLLSEAVHGAVPHELEAVAARLGVPVVGRHSALGDALTTAEVFVRLLPLLARRQLATLAAAARACRGPRLRSAGPG